MKEPETDEGGVTNMRRLLVVANKTLCDDELLERLADYMADEPSEFYLLVPDTCHRSRQSHAAAGKRLFETLHFLYGMGAEAAGKVSEQPPLLAIADLLVEEQFDEIVLSTLPPGTSSWLAEGLPHEVARSFALPVTHVGGRLDLNGQLKGFWEVRTPELPW
jgi:GABA permease